MLRTAVIQGISPDPIIIDKLTLSRQETRNMTKRDINCPFCGFLVDRVYSDISGHKDIVCKKCKRKYVLNLCYFRRQRLQPYFKIKLSDRGRQER